MELVAAVDFIVVICSCLSFVFSSSLWFLLWRVRRSKVRDSKQKRSATLLTTHVFYMVQCDILISVWCILTYTPVMMNPSISLFNDAPSDDIMNELSFTTISQSFPCFILAILGQFAVIGSAIWYIMISYCLWRILFGHNPLSNTMRNKTSFILSTSHAHIITPRNLKFRKKPDENYEITALKEDIPIDDDTSNNATKPIDIDANISPKSANKFLTTPSIASEANRDSLGLSLLSSPKDKEVGWCDTYQNRERQELSRILKRHHFIVWAFTLLLTLIPFSTGSMGINVSYIGDMKRKLECWIGSKFWLFSFYSVISVAVCNGMCMLLFISFKILKNREYKFSKKTSRQKTWRGSRRNYKVLKRFGVFVGCYLLCWILPIVQRYYALVGHNVPYWLILSSEVSIATFPMANAIVWYTNTSFRKLISKNLVLIIKYDCCRLPFTRSRSLDEKKHQQLNIVLESNNNTLTNKESKSTGGFNTLTTYGSFCDIMDLVNYSDPLDTKGILAPIANGYMNDKEMDETDEDLSFGGTIESVDMEQLVKFEKKRVSKLKHHPDVSLSSLRLPSQLSELAIANYSSSLSDEMKREHKRYSSDFTDIVAVRSGRNSAITTPVGDKMNRQVITEVITPRDEWQCKQDIHGLFTDNEEYDDQLRRLQNSIDDFGIDDYTENESDDTNVKSSK